MATMNISLPDDMKAFVEDQAAKKGFRSVSEYVRSIILELQQQTARQQLDALLIEGLDSGPATLLTQKDWASVRREGRKFIAGHKRSRP